MTDDNASVNEIKSTFIDMLDNPFGNPYSCKPPTTWNELHYWHEGFRRGVNAYRIASQQTAPGAKELAALLCSENAACVGDLSKQLDVVQPALFSDAI